MNKNVAGGGMSLTGLALFWGIVTQCLTWAGVISFSWVAIWLPFLICLAFALVLLIIVLLGIAIANLHW